MVQYLAVSRVHLGLQYASQQQQSRDAAIFPITQTSSDCLTCMCSTVLSLTSGKLNSMTSSSTCCCRVPGALLVSPSQLEALLLELSRSLAVAIEVAVDICLQVTSCRGRIVCIVCIIVAESTVPCMVTHIAVCRELLQLTSQQAARDLACSVYSKNRVPTSLYSVSG